MGIDTAGRAINHPNATKSYIITVNGIPLLPDLRAALIELTIQQEINQPAMFIMKFAVANTESELAVGTVSNIFLSRMKPGYTVSITLSGEIGVQPILLGFITAIEPEFGDETFVEVRGFDNMHRLRFGTRNRSFQMVRDSDLVSLVAGEGGVPAVATPTTTLHKYVLQNNQSNYEFLLERAQRLGWEMVMEGPAMQFRPPEQVPNVAALNASLKYADNLLRFSASLNVPTEGLLVTARAHDLQTNVTSIGLAPGASSAASGAAAGPGVTVLGGPAAGFPPSATSIRDEPVATVIEAEEIAKGKRDEVVRNFITARGEAVGNPLVQAGKYVKISNVGSVFGGTYYVTAATHHFSLGYFTKFECRKETIGLGV